MGSLAVAFSVILCFAGVITHKRGHNISRTGQSPASQAAGTKQLYAVRGEVVKIVPQSKGLLAITVRPARDYAEVTIIARENDMVGSASSSERGSDLLGVITGSDEPRDNERITAAELQAGDIVSVIYNPSGQNRAVEIYIH